MRPPQIFAVITSAGLAAAPLPVVAAPSWTGSPAPFGLVSLAPPARPVEPAPADTSAGPDDSEARRLYDARMYPAAADAFAALFAAGHVPKHLFNAAMARELAGHEGHAYVLLRRYLALGDLQPAERARAQDRLLALQRRTVAVRIAVAPDDALAAGPTLTIRRVPTGSPMDEGRAPLELAGEVLTLLAVPEHPGEFELQLEKGPWELAAQAAGFLDSQQQLSVVSGQAQVTVDLRPEPPPATAVTASFAPPEAVARGVEVTLAGAGEAPRAEQVREPAVTWQLAQGQYRLTARARGYVPLEAPFTVEAKALALDVRLSPVPVVIPPPPPRRNPWTLGLVIAGGAVAAGGISLLVLGRVQYKLSLDRYAEFAGDDPGMWLVASENVIKSWMTYGAGGGLLGAGLGLGLGALGTHLEPRFSRPRRMWGAALGVGAAFVIAGALLEGRSGYELQSILDDHSARFRSLDPSAANALIGPHRHVGASGALIGLGAGLALSGLLGLVRKPRARVRVAPTGAGLVLGGQF